MNKLFLINLNKWTTWTKMCIKSTFACFVNRVSPGFPKTTRASAFTIRLFSILRHGWKSISTCAPSLHSISILKRIVSVSLAGGIAGFLVEIVLMRTLFQIPIRIIDKAANILSLSSVTIFWIVSIWIVKQEYNYFYREVNFEIESILLELSLKLKIPEVDPVGISVVVIIGFVVITSAVEFVVVVGSAVVVVFVVAVFVGVAINLGAVPVIVVVMVVRTVVV